MVDPQPPRLFDVAAFKARQRRVTLADGADFLWQRTAEDLADRMAPVLRPFPEMLDLGTPSPAAAEMLRRLRPESSMVQRTLHGSAAETGHLALAPASLDLISSILVLQHLDDLPGALIQIRQALRPDGLFIGCILGGSTLTELRQVFATAESELTGGISPRVFPFADVRDMGGLLQRAGFALPVTDSEVITVRYDNLFALSADLRRMGGTNVLAARLRRFTPRKVLLKAAEIYAERFADADGRIRATFEIIWLSGWAPHESQQKPLKPGSAKARLADALKVPERKV
jgi:SAM-dependent methyltransferase